MGIAARVPGLGGWDDDPLWAPVYDWTVEHPRAGGLAWAVGLQSDLRRLYAATDEVARLPAGARVLDVPCGGGVGLRGLRRGQGVDYHAVDVAEPMLARTRAAARRRGVADQVRAERVDVARLPAGDATYDLVLSLMGLHCLPDPAGAIVVLARTLRPGGVVTGSMLFNDSGAWQEPMRLGGRLAGLLGPGLTRAELMHLWAAQGVPLALTRSGSVVYFRGVKD